MTCGGGQGHCQDGTNHQVVQRYWCIFCDGAGMLDGDEQRESLRDEQWAYDDGSLQPSLPWARCCAAVEHPQTVADPGSHVISRTKCQPVSQSGSWLEEWAGWLRSKGGVLLRVHPDPQCTCITHPLRCQLVLDVLGRPMVVLVSSRLTQAQTSI